MRKDRALQEAIREAGGVAALARALDIKTQSISGWTRCPADRAIDVEVATGGKVTRYELRPDVFRLADAREQDGKAA